MKEKKILIRVFFNFQIFAPPPPKKTHTQNESYVRNELWNSSDVLGGQ